MCLQQSYLAGSAIRSVRAPHARVAQLPTRVSLQEAARPQVPAVTHTGTGEKLKGRGKRTAGQHEGLPTLTRSSSG